MKKIKTGLGVVIMLLVALNIGCSKDDSSGNTATEKPVITLAGQFTNFGEVDVLSVSASQSVDVSAQHLTEALTVTASSNFQVSLDDVDFSNTVSLSPSEVNTETITLYARFSPQETAIGPVSGTLTFQSSGADQKTLNMQGAGASIAPIIVTDQASLNFGDVQMNQISEAAMLTITGDHLEDDITLTVTGNFEVSGDNVTYDSSLTIPAVNANGANTVYVRFLPTEIGSAMGAIAIQNALTTNVDVTLIGNGLPVTHNYVTFNQQPLAFGSGYSQSAVQTFNLPSDLSNIAQIKMFLQIDCPSSGCDDWDRFANVKVKDVESGNWYEIGRYITPYWTGTQQLDRGLEFDVTDFKSLLTGAVELRIYIENWTDKADLITVDFDYIEGTPDYPYYAVSEVLGYHINSIDGVPYGVPHSFDLDKSVSIPANAESTHLRTVISGWGHATPADGSRPCAEWCYRTHNVLINGSGMFSHYMGPLGCAANPVSNQNPGNWQPDRAGWCPGMAVPARIDAFGSSMAGSAFTFAYDFEDWTNDGNNGGAFYATSTYVVVKSTTPITKPTVAD
ncbi:peptide-N-glycosidase F-related protein [Mangrovimonas yunxiaonensis]|uniref:peptide-N-glycosidase F-related protein n=1 Tax=Mangrovimonas yunxiaonensis TaxID=1197477 RepID=UPI000AB2CCEE|nr:peptide-N-glycosidase F-related protein [Mangrovimonas yunxiaonensis]GGH43779.1 hypothetical protein GCM10011364_16180 [Mangrovimonas yunxiaonensis]